MKVGNYGIAIYSFHRESLPSQVSVQPRKAYRHWSSTPGQSSAKRRRAIYLDNSSWLVLHSQTRRLSVWLRETSSWLSLHVDCYCVHVCLVLVIPSTNAAMKFLRERKRSRCCFVHNAQKIASPFRVILHSATTLQGRQHPGSTSGQLTDIARS